jgi:hypothetical protein
MSYEEDKMLAAWMAVSALVLLVIALYVPDLIEWWRWRQWERRVLRHLDDDTEDEWPWSGRDAGPWTDDD